MARWTRGELARRGGVNPETIRYYESKGVLPPAARTSSNYRVYDEGSLRRLLFVQRAQELGFTLREIVDLLDLRARPDADCEDVAGRTRAKLAAVDEKIRALRSIRRALSGLLEECAGRGPVGECPILAAIEPEEPTRPDRRKR